MNKKSELRTQNAEHRILAESPKASLNIIDGSFVIEAAADDKTKVRKINIIGYTGGAMRLGGWYYPVVVALDGVKFSDQIPIYINHSGDYDMNYILGQTDKVEIKKNQIIASGQVMGESDEAKQVLALADKGFKWQASIGARPEQTEFVGEGKSVKVNGQSFEGPINVVHKSTLYEISFVARGADNNTSASIAAGNFFDKEYITMNRKQMIEKILASADNKLTREQLDAKTDDELKAMAEKIGGDVKAGADDKKNEPGKKPEVKAQDQPNQTQEVAEQIRASAAAEMERISKIKKICAGQHSEIEIQAIRENWTEDKTTLEVLRASRQQNVPIASREQQQQLPKLMEIAAIMAGGISADTLVKQYGEQNVEAARKMYRGGISLQQLLIEGAALNGYQHRGYGLRADSDIRQVLQAAFSTLTIPGILSNTANKYMLEAYMAVEQVWRKIAKIRPVKDFKTVTGYRMTGALQFEEVGPTGELKHGTLGEESFANKAKTHGKMLTITRTDIINDDLGAFMSLLKMLGRGAILQLNKVFWGIFLNNATFFVADHNNYQTGSGSALGINGLTAAELLFKNQKDADNNPLGVAPRILLVPNALSVLARQLMASVELRENTLNSKYPTANPHAGNFQVENSSYLSDSSLTGYSSTGWYLLADPNDVAVIEVVFLNGQDSPIIESAEADFNVLGVQFRGYFDFGVALQDYRGGVKMRGN
jgi:hypothetical protein